MCVFIQISTYNPISLDMQNKCFHSDHSVLFRKSQVYIHNRHENIQKKITYVHNSKRFVMSKLNDNFCFEKYFE